MPETVKHLDLDSVFSGNSSAGSISVERFGGETVTDCEQAPALFYVGSAYESCREAYEREQQTVFSPHIVTVEDARILGHGAVTTRDGELLTGSQTLAIHNDPGSLRDWGFGTPIRDLASETARATRGAKRKIEVPTCLLARPGDHIYGHWLVDILPRVFLLEQHKPDFYHYLCDKRLPRYARSFMKWLGVGQERIILFDGRSESVRVNSLTLVTNVRQGNFIAPGFHYKGMADAIRMAIGLESSEIGDEALLLTRRNWGNQARSMLNINEVEHRVEAAGFTAWAPETDPLEVQIARFSRAQIIVGENGSALHNSVFMPVGARVLSLQSRSDGSHVQAALVHNLGQQIGLAFGESFDRKARGRTADWVLPIDALDTAIAKIRDVV